MAKKKAGGTAKNLRDSNPKYLGIKLAAGLGRDSKSKRLGVKVFGGQKITAGSIIVRQRGTHFRPGTNTALGTDHTIFALRDGLVKFADKRRIGYDARVKSVKIVSVN